MHQVCGFHYSIDLREPYTLHNLLELKKNEKQSGFIFELLNHA